MCNKEFLQIQTKDEASTETQPVPAELRREHSHKPSSINSNVDMFRNTNNVCRP